MKVEICQTNIIWENKIENIKKAEALIKKSISDIVLFPEMSFTGFSMNTDITGEDDKFTINTLKALAVKYNRAIGFGWVYKAYEKAENHYTVVSNRGEVISDYIKIHPFSYSSEDKYFNKGSKISIFEYMGYTLSTFICYDLRFPEVFQCASHNAHIIIVAANWPMSRADHWKTLVRARAIENQCYVVAVNCTGSIGGVDYSGDSLIISPDGTVINSLGNEEGSIVCDIPNDAGKYRKDFPFKNDRREDLYKSLM